MLPDTTVIAAHFARTRWALEFRDRAKLEAWQQSRLRQFMQEVLPRAAYYRDRKVNVLADLPIMDKAAMMADFAACNTFGVRFDDAFAIGLRAERTRDFKPLLGDLTVGLSSGTSGNRGVFLVSAKERLRWAGVLLGRALPQHLLGRLLLPWQAPLRIDFFLRANSSLYTTLHSRRIDFMFHDLLLGVEAAVPSLNRRQPDILVGPPALLRALAAEAHAGRLGIAPTHVISVADVLEEGDRAAVRDTFHLPTHQLYQATEGFLGYTCEKGTLHLNESFMHIEPDWLDAKHTRFQPIVTDFTRETQLIVRYRLNDVLRVGIQACLCGRAEQAIASIEGRSDEILWLPACHGGKPVAIFPDLIRRAMLLAGETVREFDIVQNGMHWSVGLLADGERTVTIARVSSELDALWCKLGVMPPKLDFTGWQPKPSEAKRRRVHLKKALEGMQCTF